MKNKNAVNPQIRSLIQRQRLILMICEMILERISEEPLADQLEVLQERKKKFIKDLSGMFNSSDAEDTRPEQIEIEKAEIEINYLILEMEIKDLIDFCIRHEQSLLNAYRKLETHTGGLSDNNYNKAILDSQRIETLSLLHELRDTRDTYLV